MSSAEIAFRQSVLAHNSLAAGVAAAFCSVLALFALLESASAQGQASDSSNGVPFYTVYEAELIGAREGIADLSVDALGRLMASCGSDLIVFDGTYWTRYHQRHYSQKKGPSVFATIVGPDGATYCSTNQGLHRIDFLAHGQYALRSIAVAEAESGSSVFNALRNAFVDGKYVYFYGFTETNRFDTERRALEPRPLFRQTTSALIPFEGDIVEYGDGDALFVHKPNGTVDAVSARRWEGDFGEVQVAAVWRDSIRLGYDQGLGEFRDGAVRNWPTEIDSLPTRNVSGIVSLSDEYIAVSVLSQGIYVLDRNGNIVQSLDRSLDHRFGIADNFLHGGNSVLWATFGSSIVRIDFLSALSNYSALIESAVFYPKLFFHEGRLHVVTDGKLLRSEFFRGGALKGYRKVVPESHGIVLDAISTDEGIVFSNGMGIYLLGTDGDPQLIAPLKRVETFAIPRNASDYLVASGNEGIFLLRRTSGSWRDTGHRLGSEKRAYYSVEAIDGSIWLEHGLGQVSRLRLEGESLTIDTYGSREGLSKTWINIWTYEDEVIFSSESQPLLVWNEGQGRFVEARHRLRADLERVAEFTRPAEDALGNVWVPTVAVGHTILRRSADGTVEHDTQTLSPLSSEMLTRVLPEASGPVWLVSRQNIYRYDHRLVKPPLPLSSPTVFRVEQIRDGSVLLDAQRGVPATPLVVPHSQNSLNFRFTNPSIGYTKPVTHQYQLDDAPQEWRTVQGTNALQLSNLTEGDYSLKIRASYNGLEHSEPTVLSFTVLPPPYRTLWAYFGYVAGLGLGVFGLAQWLRHRANRRNLALQDMYEKAKAADKAKGAFLATVSHEMRTPLNAIIGPSQLLLESNQDEFDRRFLNMINNAGTQLLDFVDDVLEYTSTGANTRPVRQERFNLEELAEEQMALISVKAAEKDLAWSCRFEPGMPKHWTGDADRLRQVVGNLLNNALKFTHEGSVSITFATQGDGGEGAGLVVTVVDTGIGIAKEDHHLVFEPFQQVDSSLSRNYGGAGLGLSICKQLVERMGGEIGFESSSSNGSRFWIRLPWQPAPVGAVEAGERDEGEALTASVTKRVLLVDDNEANLAVATELLRRINCHIVTALNGKEACDIAASRRFDLILMDIRMPVMDGIQATMDIRLGDGINKDTPVIALSAFLSSAVKAECEEAGIVQFLDKPITEEALRRFIANER